MTAIPRRISGPQCPLQGRRKADRIELDELHYAHQARLYYNMLSDGEKDRLVRNIGGSLGKCLDSIQQRRIALFREMDETFENRVATAVQTVKPPKPEPKPAAV